LDTAALTVTHIAPDWRSRLLAVIGDPGIAYILLLLGIYGLLYEFANPGMAVPGVVGGICLLLAMFALQLMPINYVGLALIVLGIGLMMAEVFLPSFGVLGLGGITAFVIGSVMLIDTDLPGYGISLSLIVPVAATTALFIFAVVGMALRARKRPVVTGSEQMLGAEGVVQGDYTSEGWARVHGELWRVRSQQPLRAGTKVRVAARHDLILEVEPINSDKENDHV
jgi:membrane-bound serine protease (ClpP class)